CLEEALALATELGMLPEVAHCHLGLGKVYRRTREQAQEHLTTATMMYREMGMTYWLERAETELGELRWWVFVRGGTRRTVKVAASAVNGGCRPHRRARRVAS